MSKLRRPLNVIHGNDRFTKFNRARDNSLKDAATHITNLPKKESDLSEWQAAIEALMLVADRGGPIGVMRALNRHVEHVFDPSRKEKHWGQRKLARDR